MSRARHWRIALATLVFAGFCSACAFDYSLREYLDVRFWSPFGKHAGSFEKKGIRRVSVAYAGMLKSANRTPLEQLRSAYQEISDPDSLPPDTSAQERALVRARADRSMTPKEHEEVDLIDAKIDMRAGELAERERLNRAKEKLNLFLVRARTLSF